MRFFFFRGINNMDFISIREDSEETVYEVTCVISFMSRERTRYKTNLSGTIYFHYQYRANHVTGMRPYRLGNYRTFDYGEMILSYRSYCQIDSLVACVLRCLRAMDYHRVNLDDWFMKYIGKLDARAEVEHCIGSLLP